MFNVPRRIYPPRGIFWQDVINKGCIQNLKKTGVRLEESVFSAAISAFDTQNVLK